MEPARADITAEPGSLSYRVLAEALPQIVWTADPDGWIDYYNGRWFEYTGMTLEQTQGWGWKAVLHPDDLAGCPETWRRSVETGELYEVEYRFRRGADGAYRWHLGRAIPVRDERGAVMKWFGTCTDIHDQKLAQAAATRDRERFESLVANVPGVVYSCADDADRTLNFVSPPVEELTGYPASDFLVASHRSFADCIHPDDRPVVEQAVLYAIWAGVPLDLEYRMLHRDGSVRWVHERGRAIPGRGEVHVFEGVILEITGRKAEAERLNETLERRVEERTRAIELAGRRLRLLNTKLEASNRELQDFAFVASHDLQEPLRKVQAFADRLLAQHAGALGESGQAYLERMHSAAARMQALIDDLLDLSRVMTRGTPFAPVDLGRAARAAASDLEARLESEHGRLEILNLPIIEGDESQLRRLLQNLISNALKYHGESPPHVRVSATTDGDCCRLEVSDNGIGFDEKYLDRIFAPFQRLHGRGEYEGTGIGLTICRRIAEHHGGSITASSAPGRGATFVVTLPFEHDSTDEEATQ